MSSIHQLPSDNIEDITLVESFPTSLKSYDLLSCYNKFLAFYKLPLLPPNQTIKSFLHHLKPYKLSITLTFSYNSTLKETHIYIPNNLKLLKNHYFIKPNQLHLYHNMDLKSISINPFPQPSSQTPKPLLTTNYQNSSHQLKIYSLNTNGLADTKQKLIYDFISENNIAILGLSETHLSLKNTKLSTLSQKLTNYKNFWSSNENS